MGGIWVGVAGVSRRWHAGDVARTFGTVTLIHGPEALLAERAIQGVITAARADQPDADVHKVTVAELADGRFAELAGGSLFSPSSVLVITDAATMPADLTEQVLAVAAAPEEHLCLVVVHDGGARGKPAVDKLKKLGVTYVEASAIKPWDLPKFVSSEAKRSRITIDGLAAQALVDAVGSDPRALAASVSQLAADSDSGVVDEAVIARYFGGRADVKGYSIADDIMNGRTGKAMENLRWALETGVSPVSITGALASALRALGKYLEVSRSPVSEFDMARIIGVTPRKVKDLRMQSQSWNQGGVSTAIKAVAVADADVKGAASDAAFALEQVLLKIARARGR